MRVLAFSLLAFLAAQTSPVMAAGVLLPSDTATVNRNATPNLGLVPKQSSETAPLPTTTPAKPAVAPATTPARTPAPATDTDSDEVDATSKAILESLIPSPKAESQVAFKPVQTNITPGGTVSQGDLSDAEKMMNKMMAAGLSAPAPKALDANQKRLKDVIDGMQARYQRPPTFISDTPLPDMSKFSFASKLGINVSGSYLWGASDIKDIKNTLGYDAQTIPSQCQLRLDTKVITSVNASGYRESIHTGQGSSVGYNGNLTTVTFKPMAVCNPPRQLPQNGGVILRTGDKYTVNLSGNPSCTPTAGQQPRTLTVQYGGSGKLACKFD
jgi:hypothetical protein